MQSIGAIGKGTLRPSVPTASVIVLQTEREHGLRIKSITENSVKKSWKFTGVNVPFVKSGKKTNLPLTICTTMVKPTAAIAGATGMLTFDAKAFQSINIAFFAAAATFNSGEKVWGKNGKRHVASGYFR